jgi:hypothetical protein
MAKHEDLDFPHSPVWCDDCYREQQQARLIFETKRANDLKDRELYLREVGEWVEPRPQPRPQPRPAYALPPPQTPRRGGMRVEPNDSE